MAPFVAGLYWIFECLECKFTRLPLLPDIKVGSRALELLNFIDRTVLTQRPVTHFSSRLTFSHL